MPAAHVEDMYKPQSGRDGHGLADHPAAQLACRSGPQGTNMARRARMAAAILAAAGADGLLAGPAVLLDAAYPPP